jgi:ATP-binding cassette, subfamily B, bacterial
VQSTNRTLIRAVADAGGHVALLAGAGAAGAAAELLLPAATGRAVDAVLGAGGSAGRWLAAACALIAVAAAAEVLTDLAAPSGTARATAAVRHRLIRRMFALPQPVAARYPVGDLVARMSGQSADLGSAAAATVGGVLSTVAPIGGLVALALLDPWLAATFLLGLVLFGLLLRGFAAGASAAARGYQTVQGEIAGRLAEALDGSRTIAASGTLDRETARVLRPLPDLSGFGTRTWTTLATAAGRTAVLAPLTVVAVVACGGALLGAGRLTPGELLAAVQYAALGTGLGAVLATVHRLARARSGAGRVAEVLAEPVVAVGSRSLPAGPGALRLEGVTVLVAGRTAVDSVDLEVPGGATVAIVGRSGAGKSMLAAVAGGLRHPDGGRVLLDGVPLADCRPAALAAAVGYGFERPVLVGETIADAIGMGRPGGPAAARRAAAVAAIDDYIARLPDGYRTRLSDAPLSGGERQRLGLARAVHGERLLVLDDAASSLDSVTEARIADRLTSQTTGRTRLVVTHRPATAGRADVVAWLDEGRLRAVAPHATLWHDPEYRAVFGGGVAG